MEGTQLPDNCEGAFVNVYIGADDIRKAMDIAERNLLDDCYKPVRLSAAFELDLEGIDYDSDEKGYPGNADLQDIRNNADVWYGPFNCFPHERDESEIDG